MPASLRTANFARRVSRLLQSAPASAMADAMKLKLLQAAKDGGALSQALYEQARRELYDV